MARPNGGIIGPDNVPTPFTAKGTWKLSDAFNYIKAGLWPQTLGYQVNNSVRFNHGSSDELARTNGTATDGKKCTISFWIKKCRIEGSTTTMRFMQAYSGVGNQFHSQWGDGSTSPGDQWNISPGEQGGTEGIRMTNAAYRDSSAWYHYLWYWDSVAQLSTLYVNGESQSSSTNTAVVLNQITSATKSGTSFRIKSSITGQAEFYLAEFYIIDGQALTPSSFGETDTTTGIWKPKAYTGTFGNNGVYLKFANSASLGTDSSGNGNNFTVTNLTSVDQSTDTPTNNFATLNALENSYSGLTLSEGNLKGVTTNAYYSFVRSTIGVSKGKWYMEVKCTAQSASENKWQFGISDTPPTSSTSYLGNFELSYGWRGEGNTIFFNGTSASYGTEGGMSTGMIVGIALDLDNSKIYWSRNGTWKNSADPATNTNGFGFTPTSGFYHFAFGELDGDYGYTYETNFGNPPYSITGGYTDAGGFGNFSYQPPSGYYALCTRTLAAFG